MNRKKFFNLFAKSAAVVAVAPTVVPSLLTVAKDNPVWATNMVKDIHRSSASASTTFLHNGTPYTYWKGIDHDNAVRMHYEAFEEALFLDDSKRKQIRWKDNG